MGEKFRWEDHETELNRIFFKEFSLFKRDSNQVQDFWTFFRRYQQFQVKHQLTSGRGPDNTLSGSDHSRDTLSSKFGLPQKYDKTHRISFFLVTPDLDYKLRREHQKRSDAGMRASSLSLEHVEEFGRALRHYINFLQKQKFEKLVKIRRDQESLPIFQLKGPILQTVLDHQVVLVAGDTGCGKSTQVPQYLLEAGFGKIACTQPRRIACISLAKRVGYETLSEYGTEIAYQVRFEASKTLATKILFLTEGLLLRQVATDPELSWYNIIIVDEVHERHIHGDFLLGVLKGLVERRGDLKLVLMSATINIELFSGYFGDVPVIKVPGRLHPIELEYIPVPGASQPCGGKKSEKLDVKPYMGILQKIDSKYPASERGDLLVFLSGMNEIGALMEEAKTYAQQNKRWIILPLHSALSIEDQDKVFDIAPDGVRKCIISTNIAETSVTIDGVRFVVDSGKVKEMGYDTQAKMRRLQEFWVSRASAEQRKGRAGRTGPGVCFRMYTAEDYTAFNEYSTPEILRVPLDSLVLQIRSFGFEDVRMFPFLEPPPLSSIENAVAFLKEQGALNTSECLTPIGQMLAQLPVDVMVGKILIMGTVFHVIDPVLVVVAGLSVQSPFSRVPLGQSDISVARRPLESEHGDPFTLLNAFDEWLQLKSEKGGASHQWCKRRGLEQQRFYEMTKLRDQFQEILQEYGLLASEQDSSGGRSKRMDRLSEVQKRELRQMRKRQRVEHRKRKVLKLDDEGGAESEDEETSLTADLRDLEFKLLHDLTQLQDASNVRRSFTRLDINILKIVLCSGLYPQVAIADDCNSYRRDSEQVFHTKSKPFVVLHPTSVFATNPEYLMPHPQERKEKVQELLTYVELLETNKPYLVNTLRVPALQTVVLFSQSLDTNSDCSRVVSDCWLDITFSDSKTGQEVLSIVQTLRMTWTRLLEMKLKASQRSFPQEGLSPSASEPVDDATVAASERLLATKLAEFLDTLYPYTVTQIAGSLRPHLYRGPPKGGNPAHPQGEMVPGGTTVSKLSPHPIKGGWCITDYLTYDCLQDTGAVDPTSQYIRKVWACPSCQSKIAVTLAEQLQHQAQCKAAVEVKEALPELEAGADKRDYYCSVCEKDLQLTSIEILKHKRAHAQTSVG
ncbi:hypothetical protein EMCRGX_G022425 [Ephydatia muelleri]